MESDYHYSSEYELNSEHNARPVLGEISRL
jgi:hypothetical protein